MLSKCWKSIPIPKLTRQSKLVIERITNKPSTEKVSIKPTQIMFDVIPQVREDGYFTLNQNLQNIDTGDDKIVSVMDMKIDTHKCENGVQNVHVKLFDDIQYKKETNESNTTIFNNDENEKEDYPYSSTTEEIKHDNTHALHLKAQIPYFTNLSCKLNNANITIQNSHKIEADSHIHISTTNGNISIYSNITSKNIKLKSSEGHIYFPFNKLRAQFLYLFSKNGFIRGKLIHGGTFINLLVKNNKMVALEDTSALVDVNSIYSSSNESDQAAKIMVISPEVDNVIRVKSNHGHLCLRQHITCLPKNCDDEKKDDAPLESNENNITENKSIECNSINGSFNIKTYSYVPIDLPPSNILLHIDSLSKSSKSILQTIDTMSSVNIVLNQESTENETELRLLAQTSDPDLENNVIDSLVLGENVLKDGMFDGTSENTHQLITLPKTNPSYSLQTKNTKSQPDIQYYSGTFTNTTKKSFNDSSIGKINVQNTASTALQSFSSSASNDDNSLIVAHVYGEIKVNVLTWMDKIRNQFLKD